MSDIFNVGLLLSAVRLATPLLLAALGGLYSERAGVINIALEGLMLIGAFFAIAGVVWTGNPYLAVLIAVGAAGLIAFFLGVVVIDLKGNAIVAGLAVNIFALGFTTYLMRPVFDVAGGSFYDPSLKGLPNIDIPVIKDIPVIGQVVSGYSILVYLAVLFVPLAYVVLFHHPLGLRIRAVGEDPVAAGSIGIGVRRTRYLALLLSGALCGLAGAYISVIYTPLWVEGMVAGKGWIALALTTFATWRPARVLLGAYLFGGVTMLQFHLQGTGVDIPSQFLTMLPYVATIVVLAVISRDATTIRLNAPASLGKAYHPG